MHWLLFALAILTGGILRALYYRNRNNTVLKVLSFVVPFALGIAFWIKLFETGYQVTFYSTYVKGLELSWQEEAKWIGILGTSCMITGIGWGVGAMISAAVDAIRK